MLALAFAFVVALASPAPPTSPASSASPGSPTSPASYAASSALSAHSTSSVRFPPFDGRPVGESAQGLDAPIATKKRVVGHNNTGDIIETCRVYTRVAVVDVVDPAQMGARSIEIRAHDNSGVDVCAPSFKGVTRKVTSQVDLGYVDGVHGRWLVLNDVDSLGDEYALYVVDVDSGRDVFHAMRSITSAVVFEGDGSLTFGLVVRIDCAAHDLMCRARTLAEAHVPAGVRLDFAPQCNGSKDVTLTAALPARVVDLAHPVVTFRDGVVRCMPLP